MRKVYFHELTEDDRKKLIEEKITHNELANRHPQPLWCGYDDATLGMLGCWSLMSYMVTGRDFCKDCELYLKRRKP